VETIADKNLVIDLVHYRNERIKINLSTYLSKELSQDYSSLSKLFSKMEEVQLNIILLLKKLKSKRVACL
jgi:hypothetical protein